MSDAPFETPPLRGRLIQLTSPTPDDFGRLTELRNRDSIRRWFFDDRPLDPENNRKWLEANARRKDAKLLVIRSCIDNRFLGSAGWLHYDDSEGTIEFGRVAVDRAGYLALARSLGYAPRITDEAAFLLIGFAFRELGVLRIRTEVICGNHSSSALCLRAGFTLIGQSMGFRPNGQSLPVEIFELKRDEWAPGIGP